MMCNPYYCTALPVDNPILFGFLSHDIPHYYGICPINRCDNGKNYNVNISETKKFFDVHCNSCGENFVVIHYPNLDIIDYEGEIDSEEEEEEERKKKEELNEENHTYKKIIEQKTKKLEEEYNITAIKLNNIRKEQDLLKKQVENIVLLEKKKIKTEKE